VFCEAILVVCVDKIKLVCLDNSRWSWKVTLGGKGTSYQWSSPLEKVFVQNSSCFLLVQF
jgi:hypothetical protein